ncbi:unnamed protein product [Arctogadus glacialis]
MKTSQPGAVLHSSLQPPVPAPAPTAPTLEIHNFSFSSQPRGGNRRANGPVRGAGRGRGAARGTMRSSASLISHNRGEGAPQLSTLLFIEANSTAQPKHIHGHGGLGGRKGGSHRAAGNAGTGQRPRLPVHNLATTPLAARALVPSPSGLERHSLRADGDGCSGHVHPGTPTGGCWSPSTPTRVGVDAPGRAREMVYSVSTKAVQGRPSILQRR